MSVTSVRIDVVSPNGMKSRVFKAKVKTTSSAKQRDNAILSSRSLCHFIFPKSRSEISLVYTRLTGLARYYEKGLRLLSTTHRSFPNFTTGEIHHAQGLCTFGCSLTANRLQHLPDIFDDSIMCVYSSISSKGRFIYKKRRALCMTHHLPECHYPRSGTVCC